jgi:hypothetical protein
VGHPPFILEWSHVGLPSSDRNNRNTRSEKLDAKVNGAELPTIEESLQRLDLKKSELYDITKNILGAYGGALYSLDLLAYATVNRTLHFIPAFVHSIETKNFFVTAPLLRMQLDSCLRFSAAWIVPNCQDYASEILSGVEPRKLKDTNGRKLTDAYLVSVLAPNYPWVESVYKHCSGFVHLSRAHIVTMLTEKSEQPSEGREFTFKLGFGTVVLDDLCYIEAIEGFIACIDLLLTHLKGWHFTKDNSEQAKKLARRP